jgi:hypothetical protein
MTTFAETLRTDLPAGGDDPRDGDNEICRAKAALVERLDVDHYFEESATDTYDDAGTGKHRKVTFYGVLSVKPTLEAGECALYSKAVDGISELFFEDSDGTEKQLTSGGTLNVDAADIVENSITDLMIQLRNDQWLMSKNAAGDGEVGLIKANTDDVPVLGEGAKTYDTSAPTEDDDIANKAYVDAAHGYFASGATVFNDHVHTANAFEDLDLSAVVGARTALVYLELYSTGAGHFACKPKGYGGSFLDHINQTDNIWINGSGASGAAFGGSNDYRYLVCATNASGVIQIGYTDAADTLTIKAVGYVK